MHKVENARRKAGSFQQTRDYDCRQRYFFAWLKHESVSASQRNGIHPERHHGREVERGDPDADTKGLPNSLAIDPAGDVLDCLADQQRRYATSKLNHLDSAPYIAARFAQRLAVLTGVAVDYFLKIVF